MTILRPRFERFFCRVAFGVWDPTFERLRAQRGPRLRALASEIVRRCLQMFPKRNPEVMHPRIPWSPGLVHCRQVRLGSLSCQSRNLGSLLVLPCKPGMSMHALHNPAKSPTRSVISSKMEVYCSLLPVPRPLHPPTIYCCSSARN